MYIHVLYSSNYPDKHVAHLFGCGIKLVALFFIFCFFKEHMPRRIGFLKSYVEKGKVTIGWATFFSLDYLRRFKFFWTGLRGVFAVRDNVDGEGYMGGGEPR